LRCGDTPGQANPLSSHRELSGCERGPDAPRLRYRNEAKTMESNTSYFSRRAREELFAAIRADHHRARRAHLDMAARYDELARSTEFQQPQPAPEFVAEDQQVTEHIKIYV